MTCMRIITEEAHKKGFLVEELLGTDRTFKFARIRSKAMYRCRHELRVSDQVIADAFHRDRSTITIAIDRYARYNQLPLRPSALKLLVNDKMYKAAVEALGTRNIPKRLMFAIDAAIRVRENV